MPKEPFSIVYLGVALVIGLVTALIVTGVMKSRLKSVAPQRDATSYVRQGSMKLTNQRDLYLYREIHRTERPKETDSGSSGAAPPIPPPAAPPRRRRRFVLKTFPAR